MLGGAAACLVTGLLLVAGPAGSHAPESAAVELDWQAPAGCPDGARVLGEIDRFVAAGAQTGTVDRVQVDAVVVRSGDRYVLELDLRLPTGALHKRIEADRCEVLASATALVMAVMLDPTAVVETTALPDPVAPVAVAVPVSVRAPEPERAPLRVQGVVRILAAGSFGAMPRIGAAFGGSIGARIGRARIEATAFGELPQRRTHDAQRSAGARIDLWSLGARGCFAPAAARVDFPLCAGVEAGQMRARGFGLQLERNAVAPWLAFPFGAAAMWAPVPRLAFGGGVDGWVAATRPTFEIEDLGLVHRARRAGVRFHLGLEVRFP